MNKPIGSAPAIENSLGFLLNQWGDTVTPIAQRITTSFRLY